MEEDLHLAIPPEFTPVTSASATYFKVGSALDQLHDEEAVKKHILIATSLGHLIELQAGHIVRSTELSWKDATKIVVHHQFQPLQLYVIVLRRCQKAALISYKDLKILHEWDDVEDISSSDPDNTGVPTFSLRLISGDHCTVHNSKLLSLCGNKEDEETERGKDEAAAALANRLKGGIRHVERLNSERRMKETYISQKIRVLQSALEGVPASELKNLEKTLTLGICSHDRGPPQKISPPRSWKSPMQILSVRHKIVHDRWVIGINVINTAERTVQRRQSNQAESNEDSVGLRVEIEKLHPPVLRPKKRACILGICDIPSFSEGSSVTCSGIVSYSCKPLAMEATQQLVQPEETSEGYQISFEPVTIHAHELQNHVVTIDPESVKGGVPYSIVALVGGSRCNNITISSIISPLCNLISKLSNDYTVVKVSGVTGMYCFYPTKGHPLRHAVFSYLPLDAHKVDLTLYTKDDNQALLMVHSMLAVLPLDVNVHPPGVNTKDSNSQTEKIRHQLLAKMKEVTSSVIEGFETHAKTHKKKKGEEDILIIENDNRVKDDTRLKNSPKGKGKGMQEAVKDSQLNSKRYLEDREAILAGKGDVTFDAEIYGLWRQRLYDLQREMDNLYVKYLE
ncbi:uncharacterized protein LOC122263226 isoform X2 [Penaeus japonicus]|uniref:uncharacterized protein LOC122263226 isoform X2 n=1 Tax=Penaeus japonicus TaxID=27405 RepID=UPI001C7161D8|nr:uncharacterized protein LOC122263226 isoform X2 [Penaeus japonicus]